MSEVFLSYSRDDLAIAQQFADGLEREGFKVWWDQTLDPGEAYDHVTEEALKQAGAVVVLWSRKSVASRWVRAEATLAQRNKTLFPVTIEPCDRPIMFELTQTADLSNWNGSPDDKSWQSYVASLRRFLKKEPVQSLPVAAPLASPKRTTHKATGRTIGIIIMLALLVAGVALWAITQRQRTVAPGEVTLAVLPFADLSTARDQETFSDGLTEEILNQLAQIKGLAVTGRTSSFAFKGKNEDLRVIAEKLGVANLLEGSIRKQGKELRITAQLIDGKTAAHRWSKTYARESADVFAVQEELARDVAKALSVTLGAVEFSHAEGGTNVPEALEKFLEARALAQSGIPNVDGKIVELTRAAVTLDPEFALAWFMLADFLEPGSRTAPLDAVTRRERDEAFARGQAATPPDSGFAQFIRGGELMRHHKWTEAEPIIAAAYDAGPKYSRYLANNLYVGFLQSVGRTREAAQVQERLVRFDPLAMGPTASMQFALLLAHLPADAKKEYQRSLELNGDHRWPEQLSLTRMMLDPATMPAAVQEKYRTLATLYPELAGARASFDSLDNPQAALAAARQSLEQAQAGDVTSLFPVITLADFVGDRDTLLSAMQRLANPTGQEVELGSLPLLWLPYRTGPRADPRFKQIVQDAGLVEYWRASGNWGDFCKPVGADDFECH